MRKTFKAQPKAEEHVRMPPVPLFFFTNVKSLPRFVFHFLHRCDIIKRTAEPTPRAESACRRLRRFLRAVCGRRAAAKRIAAATKFKCERTMPAERMSGKLRAAERILNCAARIAEGLSCLTAWISCAVPNASPPERLLPMRTVPEQQSASPIEVRTNTAARSSELE